MMYDGEELEVVGIFQRRRKKASQAAKQGQNTANPPTLCMENNAAGYPETHIQSMRRVHTEGVAQTTIPLREESACRDQT